MTKPALADPGTVERAGPEPRVFSYGRMQKRANRALGLFATPALVWYAVFMIGPLVAVFLISFLRWPGLLAQPEWTGFSNFVRIFTDPNFWNAAVVTFLLLIGTVPATVVLAFMLGYYLSRNPPGVGFLRSILFVPGLISLAAITMVFVAIFSPNGLINGVLHSVGLDTYAKAWLADPNTALVCIIVISLWGAIGYNSILFASGLAGVDPSLYEAAVLDGAGQWRIMWRVAFPVIIDYFGVMTMIQYLWNIFGSAAILLLLYSTAPPLSTTTLSWLVYQKAFIQSDIGYSQAVGVVLFFAGLIGILIIRRVFRARF